MRKKIFVTGADGMVGSRFVELFGDSYNLLTPKEQELDITDNDQVKRFIEQNDPDVVVNFAAYTNVNQAEKQRGDKNDLCWRINVVGVRNILHAISDSKIHFIQFSTDMVFSGSLDNPGPYDENINPEEDLGKITWYGYTKAEADRFVLDSQHAQSTIIRIMYPVRASFKYKKDYLRGPLELYDQRKLYPLIKDQRVTISFIDEIADSLDKIIQNNIHSTVHVASSDLGTPYKIISNMLEKTRDVAAEDIQTITYDKFLEKTNSPSYRYPKYGGLMVTKSEKKLNTNFRTWQQIIDKLIDQGLGTD